VNTNHSADHRSPQPSELFDWVSTYDVDTQSVIRAALHRGIPVEPVEARPSVIELGNGAWRRRLSAITTSMTSHTACEIARSKHLTNHILRSAGVPVPVGDIARTVDEAVDVAGRIGYPVVLKPVFGARARGVFVDLESEARVREFYPLVYAESHNGLVLVERFEPGRDYRVLVVADQVVAVLERVPAFVVGDGAHTVRQLIDAANEDPRRSPSESLPLYPIQIDARTIDMLTRQGLTVEDVPPSGTQVRLKPTGSIRGGGTAVDRTDRIHPENARIACLAARAVGLDIAGIDIVTPDISQSMLTSGGAVLEVNHGPGFNQHLFPAEGPVRDPGVFVVDMLFPPGQPVRVPVVAVSAGSDSAGVCHLLANLLTAAGKTVGLVVDGKSSVDGLPLAGTESGTPLDTLLHNPAVEIAVVEVDAPSADLPSAAPAGCDVAVLFPPVDSPQSTARQLLENLDTHGIALVDVGDIEGRARATQGRHEVLLLGSNAHVGTLQEHAASGGRALLLKRMPSGAAIVLYAGGRDRTIWSEREHPLVPLRTGELTVMSVLAAVGAAIACKVPIETIEKALPLFRAAHPTRPATTGTPAQIAVAPTHAPVRQNRPVHCNGRDAPQLTIGMATYKDFDGVYFTLQALRLYHDVEEVEFLVVDNFGCDDTRRFVTSIGGRYVRATDLVGTAAAKNVVFQEARGEAVLCCDSHVLFAPGAIARLKDYHRTHPDSRDLFQGPLVYDDLVTISTHFDPVWRGQMWGVWATDPRGADPNAEPFEIPIQGMGVFSCRTAAWPGFNPAFRGFGGEEGYIHEKVRQAGGRCLCLPWLRWSHRFGRPAGVPYPLTLQDKIRNYLIGFLELGLDLDPIFEHFAEYTTPEQLEALYQEALHEGVSSPARCA
jgi:D-alanine-D-alanine ligase-like ATP-grasp enzyme